MDRVTARLHVRSKIWLEIDGEMFISKGRVDLLRAIERLGSINQASREIGISYRKAWGHIKAMEKRFGIPLVLTYVGGRKGGGARLTSEARGMLNKYETLEMGFEEKLNNRFKEIFGRFFL